MEKFTVDLDKVLDEFEYNEEQAVRHALQHFKREDLPATKYQKPHFRPINIADADFGPCIETTMSYSSYQQKHSQESNNKLVDSDNTSNNYKVNEIKQPVLNNLVESIPVNSFNSDGADSSHCKNFQENKFPVLNSEIYVKEEIVSQDPALDRVLKVENKSNNYDNNLIENNVEEVEKATEKELDELRTADSNDIKNEVKEDKEESSVEVEAETESQNASEQNSNQDLIETESSNLNVDTQMRKVSKLPDLMEVSEKISSEAEAVKIENLDLINDNKEIKKEIKSQIKPEEPQKPEVEQLDVEQRVELEIQLLDSQNENSQSNEVLKEEPITEEAQIEVTEIKPIQFETQLDITDEELQKYLEELEEEEEEEEEEGERKENEEESKPSRPDSLYLKKTENSEQSASPGSTPLPKTSEEPVEAMGAEEENLKNETADESKTEIEENVDDGEDLESLLEASVSSRSSEPPPTIGERRLGKVSPFWMPDHLASSCMECNSKFTVIKRRHHCRACGRILCSKCCGMRACLEYLQNQEQRVCETCFRTLAKVLMYELQNEEELNSSPRRPNPNNPMEYCSTVPPPLQISSSGSQSPPSVLVPVGVLKREGSSKLKEVPKQVMFSDGIRPGGGLTDLDGSEESRNVFRKSVRGGKRAGTPLGNSNLSPSALLPPIDSVSQSFIIEKSLPPIYIVNKGETTYEENWPLTKIMEKLKDPNSPPLQFAINRNLVASVKIVKLDCCMKETCWVICSKGMGCVGQDEIIILLTLDGEEDDKFPKEILLQFHYIYQEASRGNTVNESGYWCVKESTFLGSKLHGGFLFIRPTFQCLNRIDLPPPPYLFGILIHRSEIPWARVFPFRLMLRLGAEFRYYPCPLVSVRFREPVYYEIGHTIINLLADFRNLSYTIPSVRGLKILMEATQTSILIPRNRYDQVVRALNNSNDPVLALAGSFSPEADAHLVCMQSKGNDVTYSTHAININDKPRKVTGASFVVLNGALKTTSGMAAKSSIVEDGLMVQVPSDTMTALRNKMRNMEDWSVCCGPIEGRNAEEVVKIIWCEDDKNFNVGVKSVIDNMALDGVPSIRVHSGKDYMGCSKFIRWTQVFIIKCDDGVTSAKIGDPLEVNKLSESLARATCIALLKLLELLAASGQTVLAVRATMDQENVGYEAGSNGEKLAPIYMNSLDNELIPVLHKAASVNDSVAVLELVFHIMDQ